MKFLKGMGAGLLVGVCLGFAAAPEKKPGKKALSKAVKSIESLLCEVSDMIGL